MSDRKNDNIDHNGQPVNDRDKTSGADPFASLNRLLAENPDFKSTFDSISKFYDDDLTWDETEEVDYVEIDGHDYIVAQEIEVSGTTYLYLVNEDDVMDFLIQKVVVEDGEEYVTGLDSDREFDLVQAYFQRQFLLELKEKMKKDGEEASDKPE